MSRYPRLEWCVSHEPCAAWGQTMQDHSQLIATQRTVGATWLLAAAPSLPQAVTEWQDRGAAWLRPGELFSAVLLRACGVHAALGSDTAQGCAQQVTEILAGPVFVQDSAFVGEKAYVALMPASAGRCWDAPGTVHPGRALLLVPAPNALTPTDRGPWWVSPPARPGVLCDPEAVAALALASSGQAPRNGGA